jgi:hypothetical protein
MTQKHQDATYNGPERRVPEKLQATLAELSTNIKLVQQEIKSLDAKVEQRLVDNSKVAEVQYQHLDAMLEQQRRENEVRRQDDLQQHRDLIATFEKQMVVINELYKNHAHEQDTRFDALEARVSALEVAPAQKALTAKQKASETVNGILVAAGIGAILTAIAAASRWDDVVKWIGGKQ